MPGTVPPLRLSVDERLLLQLQAGHDRFDDFIAPASLTQDGLAGTLDLLRNNVSRSLQALESAGLVRHRLAHVAGVFRRVRVYGLSPAGLTQARAAEVHLAAEPVVWRQGSEERRGSVQDLARAVGPGVRPLDIYLAQRGLQERSPSGAPLTVEWIAAQVQGRRTSRGPRPPVRMVDEKPATERFVGRSAELEDLTSLAGAPGARLIILRGLAGIGKSTLASRFLDGRGEDANLLWHRAQPWERFGDLARPLALFSRLVAGGRASPSLGEATRSSGEVAGGPLLAELDRGLFRATTESWVVYDDLSQVSDIDEARRFAQLLREGIHRHASAPVKVLLLTRGDLALFGVGDAGLDREVAIRELGGLDQASARRLRSDLSPESVDELFATTGGHPLALTLADPSVPGAGLGEGGRFVRDDILAGLGPKERDLLERLAVARAPLSLAAWLPLEESEAALARLRTGGLVRSLPGDRYDLHALIAEVVLAGLPPERRRQRQVEMARQVVEAAKGTDLEDAVDPDLLLVGLRLLVESRQVDEARQLLVEERELLVEESPDQVRRWLSDLSPPESAPKALRARWAETEGDLAQVEGDEDRARAAYRRSLEIERSPGPLAKLARLDERASRSAAAQTQRQEALDLYRKAGRSVPAAWLLLETGRWSRGLGKIEEAKAAYAEARRLLKENPPGTTSEARALRAALANNEALLAVELGEIPRAADLVAEAMESADLSRDGPLRVLTRVTAAEVSEARTDLKGVERHLNEAVRIARDGALVGEVLEVALAADRLARSAHAPELRRSAFQGAEETLLRGRGGSPLPLPPGSVPDFVRFVSALARPDNALASGAVTLARVSDLVAYSRKVPLAPGTRARLGLEWGRVAEREGVTVEALNAYQEGLRSADGASTPEPLRLALVLGQARMLVASGRSEEARALLSDAEDLAQGAARAAGRREVRALRALVTGPPPP